MQKTIDHIYDNKSSDEANFKVKSKKTYPLLEFSTALSRQTRAVSEPWSESDARAPPCRVTPFP